MSTVISSSPLALRPDSLRFQNFIGEKKNKPSITTTSTTSISSPSSSVSLNMFQEHDEEILNNTPHFEYVSYDKVQDLYEQRKGHFYFIPEGFEPVLVPNDTAAQTVTNLLESTKPVSATPNVSRMLPDTDVRLPSYALPFRLKYQKLAEKAKEEHTKRFPEYKYRPRRPQDKKRHLQQPPPPTAHVGKESYKGTQIFYQNQMNEIPQINAFSAIDNNTDIDLTSNDIDGDNNNNQFTAYLQNNNNLMDFSLFQELQQSHNIDFNNYNLPLAYNYNNNNLFATKPDY
ncbi:2594_t:CDS:2 [Entrophospora sp. SA101]|nr:2594_t:CDS:2 [Entrophospora sp. SA101]